MTEFWDWAVEAYARPGVAEACLALQDTYGQNVPLLLWAAWRGGDLPAAINAAALWEAEVIDHLRHVRRNLKRFPGAEGLRERVKAVELEAERALMSALESLAGAAVDENALANAAAAWGALPPPEALDRLRAAITAP